MSNSHHTSESQARRATALKSAHGPVLEFLTDGAVVGIMLNADGAVTAPPEGGQNLALSRRSSETVSPSA